MILSMTGFAAEAAELPGLSLSVELRSVNHRFLDVTVKVPDELRQLEPVLREKLAGELKRGKVEVRAALETGSGDSLREPTPRMLQRLNALQDNVRAWLPDASALVTVSCPPTRMCSARPMRCASGSGEPSGRRACARSVRMSSAGARRFSANFSVR